MPLSLTAMDVAVTPADDDVFGMHCYGSECLIIYVLFYVVCCQI